MSWDNMTKSKEAGGSLFVKLKDGDSVEGVFVGDPYCFYSVFKDPNEYEDYQEGRSFRFKMAFVMKEDSGFVSKIFTGGARFRDMLLDAREEYGLDCFYKIKRTGSDKDSTRYAILFKKQLSDGEMEEISKLKLPSLRKKKVTEEVPPPTDEDYQEESDA